MRAKVVENTIAMPHDAAAVERAVLDAIGERPDDQTWAVRISEPSDRSDYIIHIEGPGFRWRQEFFGPLEQTPSFVFDEVKRALGRTSRKTIVPLQSIESNLLSEGPLRLNEELSVEKVDGMFTLEHFNVWRDFLDLRSRKALAGTRFALVHCYHGDEVTGRKEEESKDLLFLAFTCLRLIKPTKDRFQFIQVKQPERGVLDVVSVFREAGMTLPADTTEVVHA